MHEGPELRSAMSSDLRAVAEDHAIGSAASRGASARAMLVPSLAVAPVDATDLESRSAMAPDRNDLDSSGDIGRCRSRRAVKRATSSKGSGSSRSSRSASSKGSSWGSSIQGSSTYAGALRSRAREGEVMSFAPPARGSSSVALAGLRVFIMERLGGPQAAFERMDFHRDGRVSCLEFQEVISGQERYCGLHEARELFCLLARGTGGSLTWTDFSARLSMDTPSASPIQESVVSSVAEEEDAAMRAGGECESPVSIGSASICASSDTSSVLLAGNALRSLVLGRAGLGSSSWTAGRGASSGVGSQDTAKRVEAEADEIATTVQSLTSRSSLSCAALPGSLHESPRKARFSGGSLLGHSRSASSSAPACAQQEAADPTLDAVTAAAARATAAAEASLVPPPGGSVLNALRGGSEEMTRWLLGGLDENRCGTSSINEQSPLNQSTVRPPSTAAALNNSLDVSHAGSVSGLEGQLEPQPGSVNTGVIGRGIPSLARAASAHAITPPRVSGQSEAMRQVDEILLAWRSEAAALQGLVGCTNTASRSPGRSVTQTASMQQLTSGINVEAAERRAPASVPELPAQPPMPVYTSGLPPPLQRQSSGGQHGTVGDEATVGRPHFRTEAACGLMWLSDLSHSVQGRLAACRRPADALEVLDEVIASMPSARRGPPGDVASASSAGGTSSDSGAADEGQLPRKMQGGGSRRPASQSRHRSVPLAAPRGHKRDDPRDTAELVAASAELLKSAQAHTVGLERQFQERQRRHEQEVAELRRQQRRSRKRALHKLLDRLAPPHRALGSQRQQAIEGPAFQTSQEILAGDAGDDPEKGFAADATTAAIEAGPVKGGHLPDSMEAASTPPRLPSEALRRERNSRSPARHIANIHTSAHLAARGFPQSWGASGGAAVGAAWSSEKQALRARGHGVKESSSDTRCGF